LKSKIFNFFQFKIRRDESWASNYLIPYPDTALGYKNQNELSLDDFSKILVDKKIPLESNGLTMALFYLMIRIETPLIIGNLKYSAQ
jgi:hypothetical protein